MRKFALIYLVLSAAAQGAPKWLLNPIELAPGKAGVSYSVDLNKFLSNESGTPLLFQKSEKAAFLSISPNGVLTGTPSKKDLGKHTFQVAVAEASGDAGAITTVTVTVLKHQAKPVWPLTCESGEKALYVGKTNNGDVIYSCPSN